MRKKRTLAGVVADDSKIREEKKVILPAASRTIGIQENKMLTELVRGTEFLVDPSEFRPWKFHNRDAVWMTVERCQDLISSIRKNGQKVPIFARKIENSEDGKSWEIIAGRRRWYACSHLNIKVRVKAIEASDRECAILMNLENKDRNDISEFEDAISYRQQLEAKLFDSQDEMASALNLKKSKLSKILSAAKIINHPEVMNLFEDITQLKINPIYSLVLLIEKSDNNESEIKKRAIDLYEINSKRRIRMKPNVIINELIGAIQNNTERKIRAEKTYKIDDKIILRVNQPTNKKIIFEFNKAQFFELSKEEIRNTALQALQEFL